MYMIKHKQFNSVFKFKIHNFFFKTRFKINILFQCLVVYVLSASLAGNGASCDKLQKETYMYQPPRNRQRK